jgi:hypothetical protein
VYVYVRRREDAADQEKYCPQIDGSRLPGGNIFSPFYDLPSNRYISDDESLPKEMTMNIWSSGLT